MEPLRIPQSSSSSSSDSMRGRGAVGLKRDDEMLEDEDIAKMIEMKRD